MKKLIVTILTLALVLSLAACGGSQNPSGTTDDPGDTGTNNGDTTPDDANTPGDTTPDADNTPADGDNTPDGTDAPSDSAQLLDVNFAVLTGPTGIGAVGLWEASDAGTSRLNYNVTAVTDNSQIQNGLIQGEFDIAAVATNVASALWNKTEGQVQIIALNTLGVLYILEKGDTVHSVADLKGKTIYAAGQGANPEYVLQYILNSNGLYYSTATQEVENPDLEVVFDDASVIQTKMAAGEIDLCMLPVPAATAVLIQNQDVRSALDLTAEWDALSTGGQLTMGCVAVRTEFAQKSPETVAAFLEDYQASIESVKADPDHAATLCEQYGIVPKAPIAKRAIPDCNLTFVAGADVRPVIEPYYQVLFDANPASIGGAMPGDSFYWSAQ